MHFLNRIETNTRKSSKREAFVPLHRRLFPIEQNAREIARAAVREVLG